MKSVTFFLFIALFATVSIANDDKAFVVKVDDPYIEIHSGPGRGYPIFYVVERGDTLTVIKRKTTWFKVRNDKGVKGWASLQQMQRTLEPEGIKVEFDEPNIDNFSKRRWEIGALWGDYDGADVLGSYVAYNFTKNISTEFSYSQILGNNADGDLFSLNLVHQMYPQWRVSPFFTIGSGYIKTDPSPTLAQAEDRDDRTMNVGAGFKVYLTRRFFLRIEYKSHKILTSRNDNEERDEWKAGFSVFY